MKTNERSGYQSKTQIALAALAALLALAGCGDDDGANTITDMDGGSTELPDSGATESPDAAPIVGAVFGSVFDVVTKTPVAGTEVCMYEHPEVACATTTASGTFQLSTEEVGRVALTLKTADYADMLIHMVLTVAGGEFAGAPTIQLIHAGGLRAAATGDGVADPTKGDIASGMFRIDSMTQEITGPGVGGTATAAPDSGVGPVYLVDGAPDAEAAGIADGGYYWFGMDPGEVTLTFAHADGSCERRAGTSWPAADASRKDQSMVLIVPGYISVLASNLCVIAE